MRAVVQRVRSASVSIKGKETGCIGKGLVVLLGIHELDGSVEVKWMADKIINLRVFPDAEEKMNLSLSDIEGEMLIVSQFTLYGDCRKGRRPGYSGAAPPEIAEPVYDEFVRQVISRGITTATGTFKAMMEVSLINEGPVTLLLDSEKKF